MDKPNQRQKLILQTNSTQIHNTSPKFQTLTSDQAIIRTGSCGCFQIISAFFLISSFNLNDQLIYLHAYLKSTKQLYLTCDYQNGSSGPCDLDTACHSPNVAKYSPDYSKSPHTWITDFSLQCTQKYLIELQVTSYFIGALIGSLLFLQLADVYGRRKMIMIGQICHLVIVLLILLIRHQAVLYVALFFMGLQLPLTCQTTSILLVQLSSPLWRSYMCAICCFFDGGSNFWFSFYYKYTDSWIYLFYGNVALTVICLFGMLFVVPQSPRFYIVKKKFNLARKSLQRIAKINRTKMFQNKLEGQEKLERSSILSEEINNKNKIDLIVNIEKHSYARSDTTNISTIKKKSCVRDLCSCSSVYLIPLIIISFMWLTAEFVYYGISFGIGSLKGDIFTNGIISGAAQLFAYAIGGFISNALGRKLAMIAHYGVGAVACIIYVFIAQFQIPSMITLIIGKYAASFSFFLMFLMTSQAFPTEHRGSVFGITNGLARVGAILSPFVPDILPGQWFMFVFGVFTIVCFVGTFFLKETKGQKLQDTVEQGK